MTSPVQPMTRRRSEGGFSLVELIIVMIIIAILIIAAIVATTSSRQKAKAEAMKVIAANVGKAVATYNRMNPPITQDRLVIGLTWTSGQSEASGGLYSTTGERLLDPWPENPYATADIIIRRGNVCPASAPAGTVAICRVGVANRTGFRVMAWARDKDGSSYVIYNQQLA